MGGVLALQRRRSDNAAYGRDRENVERMLAHHSSVWPSFDRSPPAAYAAPARSVNFA